MKVCTYENCKNKYLSKGYCSKHYYRNKRHANAGVITIKKHFSRKYISMEECFEDNVEIITESGCWIWGAAVDKNGYGIMGGRINTRALNYNIKAHRYAYENFIGVIPMDLCVCHVCDIPSCVNPKHLFLATNAENTADKVSKNRQLKGSQILQSKLREHDIPVIWEKIQNGTSLSVIASEYNVSRKTIYRIKAKKQWFHATEKLLGNSINY